ncbi:MAG: FMN-binding negative transcriptional regulator [Burkholderiales bacterium]|nr:FMN-binding negative transcriptional regulator [Burkholderiales bacterium]
MYIPKPHEETRLDVLHELMRAHPLGCLVTLSESGLVANHIPFVLDISSSELGVLKGHVARANPLWKEFSASTESLVVFQGPEGYVSPTWYPTKHQTGKAVPTWNYAVVHAYGLPRAIEDAEWLLSLVSELSDIHEASQQLPWKVSDAPKDFTERLLEMIVGIEIPISRIEGKWKVSQNRPKADRLGVAAGLEAQENDAAREMAAMVMQSLNK